MGLRLLGTVDGMCGVMNERITLRCPQCKQHHTINPPMIFTEKSYMFCPKCGHISMIVEWLLIKPDVVREDTDD